MRARSTADAASIRGTRIWVDGREAGATDASGSLALTLAGPRGAKVVVTAACPVIHRTRNARREVLLSNETTQSATTTPPIELTIDCEPIERLVALVVRVRGPEVANLPLRVREHVVGQTDRRGMAHVALRLPPHSSVRVQLDTSALPELEPNSPVQTFALGDDDGVLLFEQELSIARVSRRERAARSRLHATASSLPYRVD